MPSCGGAAFFDDKNNSSQPPIFAALRADRQRATRLGLGLHQQQPLWGGQRRAQEEENDLEGLTFDTVCTALGQLLQGKAQQDAVARALAIILHASESNNGTTGAGSRFRRQQQLDSVARVLQVLLYYFL
jgi:hypothetical protein